MLGFDLGARSDCDNFESNRRCKNSRIELFTMRGLITVHNHKGEYIFIYYSCNCVSFPTLLHVLQCG